MLGASEAIEKATRRITACTTADVAAELKVTVSGVPPDPRAIVPMATPPNVTVVPETPTSSAPVPWLRMVSRSAAEALVATRTVSRPVAKSGLSTSNTVASGAVSSVVFST